MKSKFLIGLFRWLPEISIDSLPNFELNFEVYANLLLTEKENNSWLFADLSPRPIRI